MFNIFNYFIVFLIFPEMLCYILNAFLNIQLHLFKKCIYYFFKSVVFNIPLNSFKGSVLYYSFRTVGTEDHITVIMFQKNCGTLLPGHDIKSVT